MFFFDFLLLVLGVLLSVAFFTLMERKILGYVHFRKGPTKVYYFGLMQPISDALKLFFKEVISFYKFSMYFYVFGPLVGLFLMILLWCVGGGFFGVYGSFFSLIYVFCFLSLGIYFLFFCSWGSESQYSLIGGYRAGSQVLSYEVSMIFFMLVFVYFMGSYDFSFFFVFQFGFFYVFFCLLFFVGWSYVCFAESNRTPFDFSEGESELVSGFNVEYGGGLFSLIFICEYGMIIFLCFLTVVLFFGSKGFLFKLLFLCFSFVWVRCCFPRYRYDSLMKSSWEIILPFVLLFLCLLMVLVF